MSLKGKCTTLVIKDKPTRILLPDGVVVECDCDRIDCDDIDCSECDSAIELLKNRYNAFEPDGPVDKLVKALENAQEFILDIPDWPDLEVDHELDKEITEALTAYRKDALTATDGQVLKEKPDETI